jgi:hypothetical protein
MRKFCCLLAITIALTSCKKDLAKPAIVTGTTENGKLKVNSTLTFSGYTWTIKDSGTGTAGPGPNHWKGANSFVDANGYLHLKLSKNTTTNQWECAEVTSTTNFGYGTYQWQVEGPVSTLDKNIVLGFFNYSGVDGYDEMDIEYAKWGVASNPFVGYTVYPAQGASGNFHNATSFTTSGTYTTNRFKRTATSVIFKAINGFYEDDTNLAYTTTCSSPAYSISTLSMPVHMNLWLFQGAAPTSTSTVEIIVHSFKFTAL